MKLKLTQRFLLIGATVAFSKAILFIAAWLLSPADYLRFNQVYYTASTLTIFAGLGFNFSLERSQTRAWLVYLSVALNLLIISAVLALGGFDFAGARSLVTSNLLAFFMSVTGIYTFIILYRGDYKKHFYLNALLFLLQAGALLISRSKGLPFEQLFTLAMILWFAAGYRFYMKGEHGVESLKPLYRNGFAVFIINSSAVLAMNADKFFVNHYLSVDVANAYTFAWSVTAPLLYVGNILERMIFSVNPESVSKKRIFVLTAAGQSAASIIYFAVVMGLVYLFPEHLPKSVSYENLKQILPIMLAGYGVFSILHSPLNGILLKYTDEQVQGKTALYFSAAVVLFIAAMLIIFHFTQSGLYTLLFTVWAYLFTLTGIRGLMLKKIHTNPSI